MFSFCATVSMGIFTAWDCIEIEVSHDAEIAPARRFLRADLSIECGNGDVWMAAPEYERIERLSSIMLVIWPICVPLLCFLFLIPINKDLRQRRNTRWVQATAFLHKEYEPQFFFWEPIYIVLRLVLVGAVQMIKHEWMRLQAGLSITLLYTIALLYLKPYKRDDTDILAIGSQICLLGVFLGSFNVKLYDDLAAMNAGDIFSNITSDTATEITGFNSKRQAEIAMLIFNFTSVCVFFIMTIYSVMTNKASGTLRLATTSAAPDLQLHDGNKFHVFLSHSWSSGQDQVATIKRQLQCAPRYRV